MISYQQVQLISRAAFIASQMLEIKFKNSDCFQMSYKFSACETTAMGTWLHILATILSHVILVLEMFKLSIH